MRPSPEYMADLITALQRIEPDREIRSTQMNDILFSVWQDTQRRIGPLESLEDLARDVTHLEHDTGRYLSHNALRLAVDQPLARFGFGPPDCRDFGPSNDQGFEIDPELEVYFNEKLMAVFKP